MVRPSCNGSEKGMVSVPGKWLLKEAWSHVSVFKRSLLPPPQLRDDSPSLFQWLDSQRTPNDTSSIGKVLKYLIDKHGNSYAIYNVYKTLCDMDSDGQRVILEEMPGRSCGLCVSVAW